MFVVKSEEKRSSADQSFLNVLSCVLSNNPNNNEEEEHPKLNFLLSFGGKDCEHERG